MQIIPGETSESTTEQFKALKTALTSGGTDKQSLFEEIIQMHSTKVENDLAYAPVTTTDKMVETAPVSSTETKSQSTTAQPSAAQSGETKAAKSTAKEDKAAAEDKRDQRMTQDDLNKVKDELKEYGMSDKEIADLEKKVNSDEGLTWNQFVSTVAQKMSDLRKVTLTDEQKNELKSFFSKIGFDDKQSSRLISQLENGETDKVMSALQAKIDALPKDQQLLFTKEEVAAFSAAMQFSKEFTGKLQEMLGQNTMSKDLKQAFTMMNQEMAAMDEKDRKLVKAVGKAFAEATGERVKETSVAKDVEQAVDLKPRVADGEGEKAMVREDMKDAMEDRRESMPESSARKAGEGKTLPQKAETQTEAKDDQKSESDSDRTWREFFGKMRDDSGQTARQTTAKTDGVDTMLRTATNDLTAKTQTQTSEKTEAPKLMRQVEDAFIKTLNNGVKQLTVQLSPENLGKLTVALQVNGKDVSATIRAESPEAARIINEQLDIIKTALEEQGLKVDKLEVQAGLTGNQDGNNWLGQDQHNLARESEIMAAMRNHIRSMRGGTASAQAVEQVIARPTHADGLHIVA